MSDSESDGSHAEPDAESHAEQLMYAADLLAESAEHARWQAAERGRTTCLLLCLRRAYREDARHVVEALAAAIAARRRAEDERELWLMRYRHGEAAQTAARAICSAVALTGGLVPWSADAPTHADLRNAVSMHTQRAAWRASRRLQAVCEGDYGERWGRRPTQEALHDECQRIANAAILELCPRIQLVPGAAFDFDFEFE